MPPRIASRITACYKVLLPSGALCDVQAVDEVATLHQSVVRCAERADRVWG